MTQTINTDLRTALIEGSEAGKALNYAHDFTDLLGNVGNTRGFFQTLENNLTPTDDGDNLEIASGVAFVKYTKTSGEIGFLKFNLLSDQSLDLSGESDGTLYCFIELDSDKVDNGSEEIDGSDVAIISVASALPATGDYLEICSLVKSGTSLSITDLRELVKVGVGELSIDEKKIPHAKIHEFGLEYSAESLTVTVRGGVYKEDGSSMADAEIELDASATNYLDLDTNIGVVGQSTEDFSAVALYVVTTDESGVIAVVDKRQALLGSKGGGEPATTEEALAGTDDTKFMTPLKTAQTFSAREYPFSGQTTNTTQTELFLSGETDNRLVVPANSVMNFNMLVTARSSTNEMLTATVRGAIKRDNANNTSLLYTPEILYNNVLPGNLTNIVYSAKSVATNSQDTGPKNIFFKSDGLTMFVLGSTNRSVYQYNLTTAWDVSTASYASKSFSVTNQETAPKAFHISNDGKSMYIAGYTNKTLYQYTLNSAWDITSAIGAGSFYVGSEETDPMSVSTGCGKTKLYLIGSVNKSVFEYYTPSAWSLVVEADDTHEALVVKVIGESGKTINWQTKIFADLNQG